MHAPYRNFIKALGPGILFASTAIGVSHLVQSTRAGADYGLALLWAVLVANLLKYPFFEYGSRYANATGHSIIDGYRRLGKWALALYSLVTICSMFFVTAAVGAVTAGFMQALFGLETAGVSTVQVTLVLFLVSIAILLLGRYKTLDRTIKILGLVLLVSTLTAVTFALAKGPVGDPFVFWTPEALDPAHYSFAFLIALMGWMPTAIDLSAWNSLWTLARIKESGYRPTLKETLREFRLGYILSALLAPCFLLLGAYIMFGGPGLETADSALFANGVIELYTKTIGIWSQPLISAAAFSIMFGTSIGVFDGFARSAERIWQLWQHTPTERSAGTPTPAYYNTCLLIIGVGALLIIFQFGAALGKLVDLATVLSFVLGPILAWMNFRLVTGDHLAKEERPGAFLRALSYIGLFFLIGFALIFIAGRLGIMGG